jgi:succinate-acetate transporter protein
VSTSERPTDPDDWGSHRGAIVALRPIGNPLPLGFFALAVATLTLSGDQLGWFAATEGKDVALALLAFTVPAQLIAAVFSYLGRDGGAGAGMGMVAGGWFVIGLVTLTSAPGSTSDALGVFLLALAVQMLAPAIVSGRSKSVAELVLGTTALRFAVTGVYELTASSTWEDIAGIVGLVLFVLAFYAGLALIIADSRQGKGPLPVGRGKGGAPVDSDPTEAVAHEPGVRPLL